MGAAGELLARCWWQCLAIQCTNTLSTGELNGGCNDRVLLATTDGTPLARVRCQEQVGPRLEAKHGAAWDRVVFFSHSRASCMWQSRRGLGCNRTTFIPCSFELCFSSTTSKQWVASKTAVLLFSQLCILEANPSHSAPYVSARLAAAVCQSSVRVAGTSGE